jgi:ATP-dependent Lon protease
MFIVTANVLDTIPAPLRDRMEVIAFSGYTQEEKAHIASQFLCPKQIREKGLSTDLVAFTEDAVAKIIQEYTREAGIRNLDGRSPICRKIAKASVDSRGAGRTSGSLPKTWNTISESGNTISTSSRNRTGSVWQRASSGPRPEATSSSSRPRK